MLRCTGCGSTQTIEEILREHPQALSCCPERNMRYIPDDALRNLIEAMSQLLDDMGAKGQSVSLTAKAQARVAFEPFNNSAIYELDMPLIEAQTIMNEQDER
jgi:hypothetical protein